jgi:hypothetical protein
MDSDKKTNFYGPVCAAINLRAGPCVLLHDAAAHTRALFCRGLLARPWPLLVPACAISSAGCRRAHCLPYLAGKCQWIQFIGDFQPKWKATLTHSYHHICACDGVFAQSEMCQPSPFRSACDVRIARRAARVVRYVCVCVWVGAPHIMQISPQYKPYSYPPTPATHCRGVIIFHMMHIQLGVCVRGQVHAHQSRWLHKISCTTIDKIGFSDAEIHMLF